MLCISELYSWRLLHDWLSHASVMSTHGDCDIRIRHGVTNKTRNFGVTVLFLCSINVHNFYRWCFVYWRMAEQHFVLHTHIHICWWWLYNDSCLSCLLMQLQALRNSNRILQLNQIVPIFSLCKEKEKQWMSKLNYWWTNEGTLICVVLNAGDGHL